jgi:SAM-dependent methyltransferase
VDVRAEAATVSEHLSHDDPELETAVCNLCERSDAEELYRCKDYRFQVDDREWPIVRCRNCGLAYLNPRPTLRSIGKYYPPRFFDGRSRAALAARYEVQAGYLAGLTPGRLLDVGCANGDWMKMMAERGWHVAGLEPSENAVNPHGLDIRRGGFPGAATWPAESFDVITAWAVFEHLHDPKRAFERAAFLLRPGGRLIALVTNINSLFSRYSYREDVPRHLYFFSEKTLGRYATLSSMKLVDVSHDTRLYGGAGRGTLGAQLWRRLDRPLARYFEHSRLPVRARLTQAPLLGALTLGLGAVERVVLSDWAARKLRVNGHIVATFEKT